MEKKSLRETLASKILYDTLSGKERERRILVGFLTRLQLNLGEINSNEKPDFFFSLASSSGNLDVACEITEYFSDAGAHGSLQARFIRQWRRFAIALRARLNEEEIGRAHV